MGSLAERSGKYYAVIYVNKKHQWFPLHIPTTKGNKKKAEMAMLQLEATLKETPKLAEKTLFADYIKKWLEQIQYNVDTVTYAGYRSYAEKHLIPFFAERSTILQKIQIRDIEDYYKTKATGGRLDGREGGLSRRTIQVHGFVLGAVLKQAQRDQLIRENPCDYAKIPNNIIKEKKDPTFYTVTQCNELLKLAEGKPLHDMIYITFLYGLRRSEMLGLKWDAVDFNNDTISIFRTVVQADKVCEKDSTKNKSSRRVYPLLPDIKEMLMKIREKQQENRKLFGNCYCDSGYIFTNPDGNHYYPNYPSRELTRLLKKHGLPHLRWHDLRHSCASMLIEKGWHMKDISDWLGHADIGTTMNVYGHLHIDHKKKMGHTLGGLFEEQK